MSGQYIVILWFCSLSIASYAEVKLSSLFTDHMVLQRNTETPIWGWADPGAKVTVKASWGRDTYEAVANPDGQWRVRVRTPDAGGPFNIQIKERNTILLSDVLIGDVWLCSGQSNMEMPLKGFPGQPILGSTEAILSAANDQLRLYTVPRNPQLHPVGDTKPSSWKVAQPETVANFSATAYFFGKRLQELLQVPVGLIHSAYGGSNVEAWMDAAWLRDMGRTDIPTNDAGLKNKNRVPTMLYNGMIHPIAGYGIRGMIWYQGESNYENAEEYTALFTRLVREYRKLWHVDTLPFYYAQISPFDYASLPPYHREERYNSAYLRDAQRKALLELDHSGMVVTMDLGEKNCIHPARKKEVGDRFAMLALGEVYGSQGVSLRSPTFARLEVESGRATVHFHDAPMGLTSFGKEITTVEVAGEDKVFHQAQAVLKGKGLVVSSPHVDRPVAVRYAFKDFVVGELFGVNGLPVASFRTDDW